MLFDFSKSSLFNISKLKENKDYDSGYQMPINPDYNEWKRVESRNDVFLERTYEFRDVKHMLYFLTETLRELSVKNIYPEMITGEFQITVRINSDVVGEITALEINITKFIDEVYDDIRYI